MNARSMLHWVASAAIALVAAMHSPAALAVISCSISSPGVAVSYNPLASTDNDTTSTVTISCTRAASDPTSTTWQLAVDTGLNPQATRSAATLSGGSTFIKYDLYRLGPGSGEWDTTKLFSGTLTFGTSLSASVTLTYYNRIFAKQNVPNGVYLDTHVMTLYLGGSSVPAATASFPVTINVGSQCAISSAPGTVQFNYTSFQAAAAVASTSFAVTCTSGISYTMSLDATTGTVLGLNYSLSISPTGVRSGTGVAQSATINGTIAGGQAGTCAQAQCSASQARVLTITY